MASKHYFKYRSLANLRNFLDILINKRLYMAKFTELNDPMEGAYVANLNNQDVGLATLKMLRNDKDNWRICSMSKKHDNILMWAHYADSNKGCCIECSVISNQGVDNINVGYVQEIQQIDSYDPDKTAKEVLTQKLKCWSYEDEVRIMKKVSEASSESVYLQVRIHKIYLGVDITCEDKAFYTQLIQSIDRKIKVEAMNFYDLKY